MQTEMGLLHRNVLNQNWSGIPIDLKQDDSVIMPQTPNGTMITSATITSGNSRGDLLLTSGGTETKILPVYPNEALPFLDKHNWGSNNLTLTNLGPTGTDIRVQAVAPGIPGNNPKDLVVGTTLELKPGEMAVGKALPRQMLMQINSEKDLGVVAVIGGPYNNGDNGYGFAVNYGGSEREDYEDVTNGNVLNYLFNWGQVDVFVANISPSDANELSVKLQAV